MAIREKVWDCSDCDVKNIRGREKNCPSCGSPREKGEMRSMKGQGTTVAPVTDPELLKLARVGPDKFCTHCSSGNRNDAERCVGCGASFYATAEEDHPDFAGDHKRHEGVDAKLEREMDRDPRADAVPAEPPPVRRAAPPAPPPRPPTPPSDPFAPYGPPPSAGVLGVAGLGGILGMAGIVALGVLVIGFIVWAMQTHEVPGSVTSMTWTRTIHVESWVDTTTRLFRKDTSEQSEVQPRNGSGERAGLRLIPSTCRDEYYKTIQVECGSHPECKDVYRTEQESYSCTKTERESYSCTKPGPDVQCGETCRDLGNGFEDCNPKYCSGPSVSDTCYRNVEVPDTCTRNKDVFDHKECWDVIDYCDKKLYESKCDYATQVWASAGNYPTSGSGKELVWASTTVGPLQRATYSATTRRVISYVDGHAETKEYTTSVSRVSRASAEASASEYLTWTVGENVILDVNNLGGVYGEARRAGLR